MPATNFDELVLPMAEEAPHAVLLDWYRRIELAERDYLASRGVAFSDGPAAERIVAADPNLGTPVAISLARLRGLRNRHTHGWHPLAPTEAVAVAREALSLIGRLMRGSDGLAT